MDFNNGTYIVQMLPPPCSVRGFAPCIPGNGTLPPHVVVSPNGKIIHNVHTNFGPRVGFAYKVNDKTAVHGAFGIVYDNWAAVTQMVQNAEGSWPDIGQILSSTANQRTYRRVADADRYLPEPLRGHAGGRAVPACHPI